MEAKATQTHETIEARVIVLAAEQVGADPADVTADTHFEQDLNYDSLEQVEFAMEIEDEFGVGVPDEEAEQFKTVGDVVKYLSAS